MSEDEDEERGMKEEEWACREGGVSGRGRIALRKFINAYVTRLIGMGFQGRKIRKRRRTSRKQMKKSEYWREKNSQGRGGGSLPLRHS